MNPAISGDRTIICACFVTASQRLLIKLMLIGILCEFPPFVSKSLPFLLFKLSITPFEMPFET
jgi:hypothetical protein